MLKTVASLLYCVFSIFVIGISASSSLDPETCSHKICVDVEDQSFIDNPLSCPSFFQCVDERAVAGSCSGGLWFNPEKEICDVPWNVACDASVSKIVELSCVDDDGEDLHWPIECPEGLGVVQHPFNCSQFFICMDSVPHLRDCATDLEFNITTKQCMNASEANCVLPQCPPANEPLKFVPNADNCQEFAICFNGEPVKHSCAEGLHWNAAKEWCTIPSEANCQSDSGEVELVCTEESSLQNPHPTDCQQYYLCGFDDVPHLRECAEGLLFDYFEGQCRPKEDAQCLPGTETIPTESH